MATVGTHTPSESLHARILFMASIRYAVASSLVYARILFLEEHYVESSVRACKNPNQWNTGGKSVRAYNLESIRSLSCHGESVREVITLRLLHSRTSQARYGGWLDRVRLLFESLALLVLTDCLIDQSWGSQWVDI